MNRFLKFGGATARPIAGYIVPNGAKTYDDWRKDDEATPVILDGLKLLKEKMNCEAVAEILNAVKWKDGNGFPTGPYCRRTKWDGKMVRRFYCNRLLGGDAGRGHRHTVKHHESGRRVSVKNPDGAQFRHYPHLAHVQVNELDAVNLLLAQKNAVVGRKPVNGVDPLYRVSRKDSHFPAGRGVCWYCGHHHVWGGNGITGHLMCTAARECKCWCSGGYDGALAVEMIMKAIFSQLESLDGFENQYRELVRNAKQGPVDLDQRRRKLEREKEALATKEKNVKATMAAVGPEPAVLSALDELKAEAIRIKAEERELEALSRCHLDIPDSVADLRARTEEAFKTLASGSRDFNDLLRKLVAEFHVYRVRLCDGGHLLPRARVRLALDGIVGDARHVPALGELLTRVITIDLFEPPQRASIRERAVALAAEGKEQREIATALSVTQTAVYNALALDRKMRELKLDSPYELVAQPPTDYAKLRRHKNHKYRFEPLDGYIPPAL